MRDEKTRIIYLKTFRLSVSFIGEGMKAKCELQQNLPLVYNLTKTKN